MQHRVRFLQPGWGLRMPTVKRIWHMQDSQGQILALAFRIKSFKRCELFSLRATEVVARHVQQRERFLPAPRQVKTAIFSYKSYFRVCTRIRNSEYEERVGNCVSPCHAYSVSTRKQHVIAEVVARHVQEQVPFLPGRRGGGGIQLWKTELRA